MGIADFFTSQGFGFCVMLAVYFFSVYQAFNAGYAKRYIEKTKDEKQQILNYVYGNGVIMRFDGNACYCIDVANNKITTIPLNELEKAKVESE